MDPITAFIVNLIIGLVLSAASTLISSMFAQDKKQVSGVRGTIQTGGDHPLSFIMGFYGTAGHLKYAGSWGVDGETPNAYLSKVVSVSDLPVRSLAGFFVNGERVTLAGSVTGDLGYAVLEYRDDAGKDHLWVKFYDGTQTVADPLMRAKFGSEPDRPYTDTMVGRGVAYFVATALQNRALFANLPEYFAEIDGIPLDDPRGDGKHENPLVGIYTIMKGIRYAGTWLYGPQNVTDGNFSYANIEAQMDKCDLLVDGETQFRFGLEVSVDQEPQAIIGELLKSAQGRIAEIGGVYKFLMGEPGAPVVSITDEDIIITQGQTYEPFPGLEATYNGITATYPEPLEAWESKEAPPRYRSDLELLDDGRRLPFSTDFKAVPFPVQVQRLMRAAIEETRRFRRHTQTMPPNFWEYEPLDAIAWTSDRNGYDAKSMLITAMDDLPNANQFVGLQEIDPSDYDWSSDYELPWSISPLIIARPAPQVMTGWNVAPYEFPDSTATARRIGVEVFFDGGLVDVRAVRIQVREDFGDGNLVFDGEAPYDITEASPSRAITWAGIIPDEYYEVRGMYVPFSGRETDWSGWVGVTTPDVKFGPDDFYPGLGDTLAVLETSLDWLAASNKRVKDDLQSVVVRLQDQGNTSDDNFQEVRTALTATSGLIRADYELQISVVTGELGGAVARIETLEVEYADPVTGNVALAAGLDAIVVQVEDTDTGLVALANSITSLETSVGSISADARIRMVSQASSGSSYATVGIQARASTGDDWTTAAILLDSKSSGESRVLLVGQRIGLMDSVGTVYAMFDATGAYFDTARIQDATIGTAKISDAAITSAKIGTAAITNAKIGDLEVNTIKIANQSISETLSAVLASNVTIAGGASNVTFLSLNQTPRDGTSTIQIAGTISTAGSFSDRYGGVRIELVKGGTVLGSAEGYVDDVDGSNFDFAFASKDASPGTSALTYILRATRTTSVYGITVPSDVGPLYAVRASIVAVNNPKG